MLIVPVVKGSKDPYPAPENQYVMYLTQSLYIHSFPDDDYVAFHTRSCSIESDSVPSHPPLITKTLLSGLGIAPFTPRSLILRIFHP